MKTRGALNWSTKLLLGLLVVLYALMLLRIQQVFEAELMVPASQIQPEIYEQIWESPKMPTVILPEICHISTEPAEQEEHAEPEEPDMFSLEEIEAMAQMLYGEARYCAVEGQAAIIWCVFNRVDSEDPYFPDSVLGVVKQPNQFFGYRESNPVLPELVDVVEDVAMRYAAERSGIESVGRVLPREYLYFSGDRERNYFTITYASNDVWDWSLGSPYVDAEGVRNCV